MVYSESLAPLDSTHISIIGSCVSRDVFEICKSADGYKEGAENTYIIDRYIQNISPAAACLPAVDEEVREKFVDAVEGSACANFYKRNFMLDLTKQWYEYLKEEKSQWLVIDMTCIRLSLRKIRNSFISWDLEKNVVKGFGKEKTPEVFEEMCKNELVVPRMWDKELLKECYAVYLDNLTQLYRPEQIIVIEAKNVFTYADETKGKLHTVANNKSSKFLEENEAFDFIMDFTRQYIKNAHFIDFPPVCYGDINHKWGQHGLHYSKDAYLYYFRCIDLITHSDISREKEIEALKDLQISFAKKIYSKLTSVINLDIKNSRNLFDETAYAAPGVYNINGITLTVSKDYKYTITGTATKDTTLFLISGHRNPIGKWSAAQKELKLGTYNFSTDIVTDENFRMQLILSGKDVESRYISGNLSNKFSTTKHFSHMLIRAMIKKDAQVNENTYLHLERL